MTHDEAFLQAIREAPEDDAPCLIYADWLEEHGAVARAEFIRAQCLLPRLGPADPRGPGLQRRVEELLDRYWEEWVGPLRKLVGPKVGRVGEAWLLGGSRPEKARHFRRGFVEELSLAADVFLRRSGEIARTLPLLRLKLWGAGDCAEEVAAAPYLDGLASLSFVDYFISPLGERGASALARSPHLGRLHGLYLFNNNVGDGGAAALAEAPWLRGLSYLVLSGNELTEGGARSLAAVGRCRLTDLFLAHNDLGTEGVQALAGSELLAGVRALDLGSCNVGPAGAAALAASPHLGNLRYLFLRDNPLGPDGARALAAAPWLRGLRQLSRERCGLGEEGAAALGGVPEQVRPGIAIN
jgi:uncharacterized protein (TIGR02996 family)